MANAEPFDSYAGYTVGIPPVVVVDGTGNVVTNVNAPQSNVTANQIFANSFLYSNGSPISIGAAGNTSEIQYNNNGLLAASSAFTFDIANSQVVTETIKVTQRANLGSVSNVKIQGGFNGYYLQTDGTGNLTWTPGTSPTPGNGLPGGANTQIQYNDSGLFGGSAGFTYNKLTDIMTVGNMVTGNLTVNGLTVNEELDANVISALYLAGDGSNITNVSASTAQVAYSVAGSNVTGQVNYAAVANSVAGSNVTGQVNYAAVANSVAGSNVTGQVSNALVAGTVYTANQPNITDLGNLNSLTVIGNTTLGNQTVSNYFIGNLFGLANLARNVTYANQPNITGLGTLTSLTVSGNTMLGNTASANYFVGDLYGQANTSVYAESANTANSATVANTANLANFANVANTVYNSAQPNITSLGNLLTLTVSGQSNFNGSAAFSAGANFTGANPVMVSSNLNTANSANVSLGTVANLHITGGNNGDFLSTNGSGNLSWQPQVIVTPTGANKTVQYNYNGNFAGSTAFTYDNDTAEVNIHGNLLANAIVLGTGIYEISQSNVYFATTTSTVKQTLLAINTSEVAAVDYTIISTDASANIREFTKISTVVMGSDFQYIEHSSLQVNGFVGDFIIQYDAGPPATIQLVVTPLTANLVTHRMTITTYYE